jgi:hypothetical protein
MIFVGVVQINLCRLSMPYNREKEQLRGRRRRAQKKSAHRSSTPIVVKREPGHREKERQRGRRRRAQKKSAHRSSSPMAVDREPGMPDSEQDVNRGVRPIIEVVRFPLSLDILTNLYF